MDALAQNIGYYNAMRVKNLLIFMAGGYVYLIIGVHVVLRAFKSIRRDERAAKVSLMRIEGKYIAYPQTILEYYETLWVWLSARLMRTKTITFRNMRVAKAMSVFFVFLAIVFIIVGVWLMIDIQDGAKYPKL